MAKTVPSGKVSNQIYEKLKGHKQKHKNKWAHTVPFACGII
jgi:hypothetical protein